MIICEYNKQRQLPCQFIKRFEPWYLFISRVQRWSRNLLFSRRFFRSAPAAGPPATGRLTGLPATSLLAGPPARLYPFRPWAAQQLIGNQGGAGNGAVTRFCTAHEKLRNIVQPQQSETEKERQTESNEQVECHRSEACHCNGCQQRTEHRAQSVEHVQGASRLYHFMRGELIVYGSEGQRIERHHKAADQKTHQEQKGTHPVCQGKAEYRRNRDSRTDDEGDT